MSTTVKDTWAGAELQKYAKELTAEVGTILEKAAKDTMEEFYKDYPNPKYYDRTGNLKQAYRIINQIAMKPNNNGSTLMGYSSVTFSPSYMTTYKHNERFVSEGLEGGYEGSGYTFEEVNPAIVFDLDFLQGYHGGKSWQATRFWEKGATPDSNPEKWQPAKRMSPPPYERMKKRYEAIVKDGGPIDVLLSRDRVRKSIDVAIMKDLGEVLDSVEDGGKK